MANTVYFNGRIFVRFSIISHIEYHYASPSENSKNQKPIALTVVTKATTWADDGHWNNSLYIGPDELDDFMKKYKEFIARVDGRLLK